MRSPREKEQYVYRPCGGGVKSTFEENVVEKNISISYRGQTDAPTYNLQYQTTEASDLGACSGLLLISLARKPPTGRNSEGELNPQGPRGVEIY